jgi:diguanylate cyclase (GGDEF)-like protein
VADTVIIDATTTDVHALCQRLNRTSADANLPAKAEMAPLLALVDESADFKALAACGIDDFISQQASDTEIKARLSLAVRLGRAQRELRSAREELRHLIQTDDLSGALNRRFFFQSAYRECSRARRYGQALSCLMVDIDHFHLYNTSFGYGCGDYILREVATILKNSVRDTDLVARFGGSKFVVLLTHTDTEGAITVRQKIENSVNGGYFVWQHQRLPITVSIGEAERVPERSHPTSPEEGEDEGAPFSTREDLAELLEDADSALYIAKKGARFPTFLEVQPEQ